jgi:hypothetical protein
MLYVCGRSTCVATCMYMYNSKMYLQQMCFIYVISNLKNTVLVLVLVLELA